jgi:Peptidase family M1 domain
LQRATPRTLTAALVVLVALCASACAIPLSPGYRILKESREVRFVPGQSPELQIHVRYKIQNSGNSDLAFVDVAFPEEQSFGRKNLRVEVDGHEAAPAKLPAEYQWEQPNALRIALDPPWARKQNREFSIEYAFVAPANSGAAITLDERSFHLGSRGWLPQFQPPKHLLAPYPGQPDRLDYIVRVPADFLILARGAPKGKKGDGGEIEYRYELDKGDLALFITAGRYVATPADRRSPSAVFWTIQPLKDDPGPAIEQITAAWSTLEKSFGPLDKNITAPHIVESPALRGHFSGEQGPVAAAFPGGALVNPAALELGTGNPQFLQVVTHALAHNWFGDEMYPAPDAALGIGEGLPEYATVVVDEVRNGPAARHARILQYLRRYNEARNNADETPLGLTMLTAPAAQRRIALAKAPLFFIALEDTCGETEMRKDLAHLIAVSRGQEVSYDSLRSALEQSSGRNLAEMFRFWLNEKGLPQDFLDRYRLTASGPEIGQ